MRCRGEVLVHVWKSNDGARGHMIPIFLYAVVGLRYNWQTRSCTCARSTYCYTSFRLTSSTSLDELVSTRFFFFSYARVRFNWDVSVTLYGIRSLIDMFWHSYIVILDRGYLYVFNICFTNISECRNLCFTFLFVLSTHSH